MSTDDWFRRMAEELEADAAARTVRVTDLLTGGVGLSDLQETASALVDSGQAATLPDAVQRLSDALNTPLDTRMPTDAAVAALDALYGEPDANHGEADKILLAVAPPEVAAAYRRLVDRSDWWATA